MEIKIETYSDLLEFIKRDEVPKELALEIVSKFLNVIILIDCNKLDLIKATENHIEKWGLNYPCEWEQPIFLDQNEIN
jgi:hypothetical protein